ncbi:MAG: hypothetical protein RJA99_3661 [Pseudomonadota bacterium]|jgi:hypothetical protein
MASGASKAFDMGKMAIGGIGQMLDSVEFVKRAWSTLNIPSQMVPTVDIDELDKRIADLKAVEQWLNVNLSMLHGTIQGLEIQRGTLAAVKAFGASFGALAPQAAAPAPAPSRPKPTLRTPAPAAAPAPAPEPEPEQRAGAPGTGGGATGEAQAPAMPGINPGVWWNLLQQNFNQVAQAALSGGGLQDAAVTAMKAAGGLAGAAMPGLGPAAGKPAAKPATKPVAKAPAARKPAAKKKRAPARKAAKAAAP